MGRSVPPAAPTERARLVGYLHRGLIRPPQRMQIYPISAENAALVAGYEALRDAFVAGRPTPA